LKKVLVLGGGYAGLFAASNLSSNNNVEVTLVNDGKQHQLLQKLHRVASGELGSSDVCLDIKGTLGGGVEFVDGRATGVDLGSKQVQVKLNGMDSHQQMQYDYLVIALGATNEYYGIKGASENSCSMRSVREGMELDRKINALEHGSTVCIAGGGATGISLAGAISDRMRDRGNSIKVIEAKNEILPGWEPVIVRMAKERLENKGVGILTGNAIKEIGRWTITLQSGAEVKTDLTVWTAGVRARDLDVYPAVRRTPSGRILVDRFSRVLDLQSGLPEQSAFAIGDISAFPLDYTGRLSPQLAQFAVRQARNVAKNILRQVDGLPMTELEYVQKGELLSFGTDCVGTLNGFPVSGCLCEKTEDFIIDNYLRALSNKGEGIEGMVYDGNSMGSQVALSFNFLNYIWRSAMIPS
jgi:NADH dehydrogenase